MFVSEKFSAQVREQTLSAHQEAEDSPLMTSLVAGELNSRQYGVLLVQLQHVYTALDAAGDLLRTDPIVGGFFDPRLARGSACAADIAALDCYDVPVLPQARAYADRITELATTWPGGVVAHHYTRYLGDLSGGQVIATTLSRSLGLSADHGLAFFDFPGIKAPPFRRDYRDRLDSMPWSPQERYDVVAEVQRAFRYNSDLFAAVHTALP